jgi:DsbC/DsbD-like thiol-disulfide interchange protein
MNRWTLRLAPLVVLTYMVTGSSVQAQKITSADVVKATATADKPDADGKQTMTITLNITSPWHIYANPVEVKELANEQTVVTVSAAEKLAKVDIVYPAGKLQMDKGLGNHKIYEDTVTIKATVVRAKGDTSPLTVEVVVSACNKNVCLLPGTIKVPVK